MREIVPRQSPTARRVPGIEGLRALAAGGVVLFHAYYYQAGRGGGAAGLLLRDCALGVTLFFTLSGFLLFRPYARAALCGTSAPGVRNYLRNRALRIVPAYWTVLGVCALTFGLYETVGPQLVPKLTTMPPLGHLLASTFLVQNYTRSTFGTGLPQAWSLAVEVGVLPVASARRTGRYIDVPPGGFGAGPLGYGRRRPGCLPVPRSGREADGRGRRGGGCGSRFRVVALGDLHLQLPRTGRSVCVRNGGRR